MKANKLKINVLIIATIISFCLFFSASNAAATTVRNASNYDDTTAEKFGGVWYNNPSDYQSLRVDYALPPTEGVCIIRGIGYGYVSLGVASMKIRFVGDSFWVEYIDTGIPAVPPPGDIRAFWCAGPTYLLDDDPSVELRGDTSELGIGLDTPSDGHSFYENDGSGGWILDWSSEYIVDLLYEWVVALPIDTTDTGSLTSIDNLDAYFITLTSGNDYQFDLARTSGTGDLDMRIVTYQDLTNDNLVQSSGSTYPKSMNYVPSYTGTYVLLVEADTFGDVADYSINYFLDQQPAADFTANTTTPLQHRDVGFTYTGTDGNPPLSYEWNFGDGSPVSNDQNPIHSYSTASTYTVSLLVTDVDSDSDTETKVDYITVTPNLLPSADFTANATEVIVGEDILFTFTGDLGDTPTICEWDFGDGSPICNDQNPVYNYTAAGNYIVTLTITDTNTETDTIIKIDYIVVTAAPPPSSNGGGGGDRDLWEAEAIPGYNIPITLGIIAIVSLIMIKRKRKK